MKQNIGTFFLRFFIYIFSISTFASPYWAQTDCRQWVVVLEKGSSNSAYGVSWYFVSRRFFTPRAIQPGSYYDNRMILSHEEFPDKKILAFTPVEICEEDEENQNLYQDRVWYDKDSRFYIQRVQLMSALEAALNFFDEEISKAQTELSVLKKENLIDTDNRHYQDCLVNIIADYKFQKEGLEELWSNPNQAIIYIGFDFYRRDSYQRDAPNARFVMEDQEENTLRIANEEIFSAEYQDKVYAAIKGFKKNKNL